jgi:hypothetical protein
MDLKWVPVISLAVSVSSLIFAATVLYPWHLEISSQIAELQYMC